MSWFSLLRRRSGGPQASRKSRPLFRPRLEVLEGRLAPATLVVTTPADSGAGSLRAEIAAASSGDSIAFDPSLNGKTITLTSGELLINKSLSITGPGAGSLSVSGNHASQVFDVATGTVSLSGLTIIDGAAQGSSGVFNQGTLTVTNCTFSGNSGGAIGNGHGTLTVTNCTSPANPGGGVDNNDGTLTVTNSVLSGNSSNGGGGIFNFRGTLTVTNCTLSGNTATLGGGGIANIGGTLTVTDSAFS